ncbi:MAG: hypothetical protein GY938_32050 [Ketobacter sp.]|nr:hypothetical protein [Ketobacter sp.]
MLGQTILLPQVDTGLFQFHERRQTAVTLDPRVLRIRNAKKAGVVTPQTVADFAYLHMRDDETGLPIEPAAHHWLWLRLMCNTDIKRLLIIATPESAKTTWMIAYTACMVGFFPQSPGVFAASSNPVAKKRSVAVRTLTESDAWRQSFPGVIPARGMSWQQDEWSMAPDGNTTPGRVHPTVSAYGTGSIEGSRAKWLVGDDLLTYENTRTAHQRNVVNTWFHASFLSRVLAKVGVVRIIGNAWHHDDTHAKLRRSEGWVTCHMQALSESKECYATITYPDDWQGERIGEAVAKAEI